MLWAAALSSCGSDSQDYRGLVFNEIRSTGEEYLELFNTGSSAINLSGFRLTDGGRSNPRLDRALTFDDSAVVQPGEYLVVFTKQAVAAPGPQTFCPVGVESCFHSTWGISEMNGDEIVLVDTAGAIVLSVRYRAGSASMSQSWGRLPNGTGGWEPNDATPGMQNRPATPMLDAGMPPRDTGTDCVVEPGIIEALWTAGGPGTPEEIGPTGRPDAIFLDDDVVMVGDEDGAFQEIHLYDLTSDDPTMVGDRLTPLADLGGPSGFGGLSFSFISGLAEDPATGNIYVAEQGRGSIQVLRNLGESPYYGWIDTIGMLAPNSDECMCLPEDGQFVRLQAVRFDPMGRLWASDDARWFEDNRIRRDIQVFTATGEFLFKFGDSSAGPQFMGGNLEEPENFVIDEARNRVYVCDEHERTREIVIFNYDDQAFVTRFGRSENGVPNGIDIDQHGNVYVMWEGADGGFPEETSIRVYDPASLAEIFRFGGYSESDDPRTGYFNSPDTMIIDVAKDVLMVADQGHRIAQGFRLSEIQTRGCLAPAM